MGHRGMDERAEVTDLSDDASLERVSEAREQVRLARIAYERAVIDVMIRGLNQTLIAKTAGVTRGALFDISSREWERRQTENPAAVDTG